MMDYGWSYTRDMWMMHYGWSYTRDMWMMHYGWSYTRDMWMMHHGWSYTRDMWMMDYGSKSSQIKNEVAGRKTFHSRVTYWRQQMANKPSTA